MAPKRNQILVRINVCTGINYKTPIVENSEEKSTTSFRLWLQILAIDQMLH